MLATLSPSRQRMGPVSYLANVHVLNHSDIGVPHQACGIMPAMRLMLAALVATSVIAIVAACGPGDSLTHVLNLESGSIPEGELRFDFRAIGRDDPRGIEMLCDRIWLEEIDELGIIETLIELGLALDQALDVEAEQRDLTRAVEIVEEECLRWANI